MGYDTFLFKCGAGLLSIFMPELQEGFYIPSYEGRTIYSFLTDSCRMSETYISQKVKTVLFNGGPVDDIFNTKIKDGGTCALSGAMPGIVGAMMRMGSPYAAMRDSITVRPDESSESGKQIFIRLKLFNIILYDTGPGFLREGILLEKKRVFNFFSRHGEEISSGCREVLLNNTPVGGRGVTAEESEIISELVILKIETEDENKS